MSQCKEAEVYVSKSFFKKPQRVFLFFEGSKEIVIHKRGKFYSRSESLLKWLKEYIKTHNV
jgi:hypothetical protein